MVQSDVDLELARDGHHKGNLMLAVAAVTHVAPDILNGTSQLDRKCVATHLAVCARRVASLYGEHRRTPNIASRESIAECDRAMRSCESVCIEGEC